VVIDTEAVIRFAKRYANDARRVLPVDRVWLFGSYAKGTATEQSDIDICFFLDNFGGRRRVDILRELLGLINGYDGVFFEPTVFPTAEIQNDNPFVKEVLRTGREIF
jgi:predicted nucleotidyltransferase